jgi:hypothetical protein
MPGLVTTSVFDPCVRLTDQKSNEITAIQNLTRQDRAVSGIICLFSFIRAK